VQGRERGVGRHAVCLGVRRVEDRPRRGGGAREPALAHLPVRERGLEELPHHPERELALELAAASGEHPHVVLPRGPPQLREQPALSNPGRALHQRQPATAALRALEHGTERVELAVWFEEQFGWAGVAHRRSS